MRLGGPVWTRWRRGNIIPTEDRKIQSVALLAERYWLTRVVREIVEPKGMKGKSGAGYGG
jgi:hypothetical protein